jgi:hypothetical protein
MQLFRGVEGAQQEPRNDFAKNLRLMMECPRGSKGFGPSVLVLGNEQSQPAVRGRCSRSDPALTSQTFVVRAPLSFDRSRSYGQIGVLALEIG